MRSFGLFAIVPTAAKYMACALLAEQADARLQLTPHERARSVSRAARRAGYLNARVSAYALEVLEAFHAGEPTPESPYRCPMRYRAAGVRRKSWMHDAGNMWRAPLRGH
jgi:hypothetical protein